MTKTDAINNARAAVGHPVGRGTSWQVFGPYYSDRLNGPSTSIDTDTYARAESNSHAMGGASCVNANGLE